MNNFNEKLTTAVFTTKYVVEHNSPILYVYHFDDGSWQFSGAEANLSEDDYRIVSLGEIFNIDPTVKVLGEMNDGFEAFRSSLNASWKIVSSN